jgi:ferredoxin-NADP reductase
MTTELFTPTAIAALATAVVVILLCILLLGGLSQKDKKVVAKEDISRSLRREMMGTSTTNLLSMDLEEKVLNPATFKTFTVLQIKRISHNTKLFRFEIPFGRQLGLNLGRHITVKSDIDGQKVMRAYTPTSKPDQRGYFELLVKSYEYGKLSTYMHSLKVGSAVEVRGPVGRFKYVKNSHKRMGLIAAGSGLTPCLQVLRCVLEGEDYKDDTTSFTFLYQNRFEADILLREDLDRMAAAHPARLTILYFLSNPSDQSYGKGPASAYEAIEKGMLGPDTYEMSGYINKQTVSQLLAPSVCQQVCMCGPSGFNESMKALLVAEGHVDVDKEDTSLYVW